MALRSLPAGAGFKPPRAALAEDRGRERRGKGESTRLVRCGSGRRVQANHREGFVNNPIDIKTVGHITPATSPSDVLLTGWAVSGVKVARA